MGLFGGVFTGSNPTLEGDIGNAGNIMSFGTGVGEGAVQSGLGFEESLLSGNPTETAKLLAPEIADIQQGGQQQIQTSAEFANRSGGTNASNQQNIDKQRAAVNDMISKLTGKAASTVTSTGENLLGTALNANQLQEKESQDKLANEQNSILGGLITRGVNAGASFIPGF